MIVQVSRRTFLASTALLTGAIATRPRSLFAQEALPEVFLQGRASAAAAKITTVALRRGLSALIGSGGNIVVLPGKDGKVILDAGYSTSRPQITVALNAISSDPLALLINTHWHFDHTDGNEWMHGAGATIMATDKTKARLSVPTRVEAFHATMPALPEDARPTRTFNTTQTLNLNGDQLLLVPYEPAHTDTDASIYFEQADVLHTGDTWFHGFYPFIDYSTGGSIDGMIRATERNLKGGTAKTLIVPGHGPVGDKSQLTADLDMLQTSRSRIAVLKKQGNTLEDVVAAKPLAQYESTYGAGFMSSRNFIALVYEGV